MCDCISISAFSTNTSLMLSGMQLDSLLDMQNSQTAAFKCSCALDVFPLEGTRGCTHMQWLYEWNESKSQTGHPKPQNTSVHYCECALLYRLHSHTSSVIIKRQRCSEKEKTPQCGAQSSQLGLGECVSLHLLRVSASAAALQSNTTCTSQQLTHSTNVWQHTHSTPNAK